MFENTHVANIEMRVAALEAREAELTRSIDVVSRAVDVHTNKISDAESLTEHGEIGGGTALIAEIESRVSALERALVEGHISPVDARSIYHRYGPHKRGEAEARKDEVVLDLRLDATDAIEGLRRAAPLYRAPLLHIGGKHYAPHASSAGDGLIAVVQPVGGRWKTLAHTDWSLVPPGAAHIELEATPPESLPVYGIFEHHPARINP